MVEFVPSFNHVASTKSAFTAPTGPIQMTQTGASHSKISTQIPAAPKVEPRE